MALHVRVRRLPNPRRPNAPKRNRKMTPKQIRFFGTKRQKAALKAKHHRVRANPPVKRKRRMAATRKTHRSRSNPGPLLVTLGPAVNPRQRRKNVATKTKKRRSNASHSRRRVRAASPIPRHRPRTRPATRNTRRRRANPAMTKVVYRYRNARRRKVNARRHHKRNPDILGISITSKSGVKLIAGGLGGVALTKFGPTLLPAGTLGSLTSNSFGAFAISAIFALGGGYIGSRFDKDFGAGMTFGGLMQATSVLLNGLIPSAYKAIGAPLAGMGDLVPGRFAVPQNPLYQQRSLMPPVAVAPTPTGSAPAGTIPVSSPLNAAYGAAYG